MSNANIILIIFILNIIATAIGDGLRQRDIANPSFKLGITYHIFWVLSYVWLGLLVVDIHPIEVPRYILAFMLIRFGIFDYIRNIANGKGIYYIGNTAGIDRIANKWFASGFGAGVYMFIKGVAIVAGMFLIQNYNNYFN